MEYLKGGNKKETKFRLKEEVYSQLEKLSQMEGKSINLLVNEILEKFLSERLIENFDNNLEQFFFRKNL
jgi:predicted DNA-binding protein